MRATSGQCGLDSSHCHSYTVGEVAKLGDLGMGNQVESSDATLLCATTLHRFGLPYDFARLDTDTLLESCANCSAPLWAPAIAGSRLDKMFAWQCHLGRCGGDGKRLQAHEVIKEC